MISEGKSFSDFVMNDSEKKVFDIVSDTHAYIDSLIYDINEELPSSRERSLVITKLQEANFWLSMVPLS